LPEKISRITPIRDRWSIRLALLAIPVLVMGVNALAVGFMDALSSVMIETAIQVQINTLTGIPIVRFLNQIFPFILTITVLTWYLRPVYIRILNAGGDNHFGRDLLPILDWAIPIVSMLIAIITWLKALCGAFNDMAQGLEERERMRGIFGRVVDPRVRDRLMERDASSQGEIRQATVVFFDLAGFASISESLPAKRVVFLLNLYFDAVNVTSRLEPLGKIYGMDIIMSKATVGSLRKKRALKPLGLAEIRGKQERLELFGL